MEKEELKNLAKGRLNKLNVTKAQELNELMNKAFSEKSDELVRKSIREGKSPEEALAKTIGYLRHTCFVLLSLCLSNYENVDKGLIDLVFSGDENED
jgi:hypothetical protein